MCAEIVKTRCAHLLSQYSLRVDNAFKLKFQPKSQFNCKIHNDEPLLSGDIKLINLPFSGNTFVHAFNVKTCFTKRKRTTSDRNLHRSSFQWALHMMGGCCRADENDCGGGNDDASYLYTQSSMHANKLNNLKSVANI